MSGSQQATCPNCGFALTMTAHDMLFGGGVTCGNCHTLLTCAGPGAIGSEDRAAGIYGHQIRTWRVD